MKTSQISLLVFGFILIALMATNPSIEDHRIAVFDEMKEKIPSSSSSVSTNEWQKAGEAIGFAIGKGILENAVSRENYILFSGTKITLNGNQKFVGIGILGNVWVNNEILKSGNKLYTNLNTGCFKLHNPPSTLSSAQNPLISKTNFTFFFFFNERPTKAEI